MTPIASLHPPRRSERGGVSWLTLLLIVGVLACAYYAVAWVPVWVLTYEVKQTVRDYMNQAIKDRDDAGLTTKLCAKLAILDTKTVLGPDGAPLKVPMVQVAPSDVTWERHQDSTPPTLHVAFEYTVEVHYPVTDKVSEYAGSIDLENDLTIPDWGPAR